MTAELIWGVVIGLGFIFVFSKLYDRAKRIDNARYWHKWQEEQREKQILWFKQGKEEWEAKHPGQKYEDYLCGVRKELAEQYQTCAHYFGEKELDYWNKQRETKANGR